METGILVGRTAIVTEVAFSFFFFHYLFILFLAVLGLCCSTWDFCCGVQAFHCGRQVFSLYLWRVGSVVVACGLSCPAACGILVP